MTERLAVVSFTPDLATITPFEVDFSGKEIAQYPSAEFSKDDYRSLRRHLRWLFYPLRYDVIFTLPSTEAVTVYERSVSLRENPRAAIDEGEIDNFISDTLWRLYERTKPRAIRALNISDADLLFRDASVFHLSVDEVPWGSEKEMKGRQMDLELSVTFASRDSNHRMESLLPDRASVVFFAESGSVATRYLSQFHSRPFLFGAIDRQMVYLFLRTKDRIAHYDSFAWGWEKLEEVFAAAYNISPAVASSLFGILAQEEASPHVLRHFRLNAKKETRELLMGLTHARDRANASTVCLASGILSGLVKLPKMITFVPDGDIIPSSFRLEKKSGSFFPFIWPRECVRENFFPLASLSEYLSIFDNRPLQHLARRRVRWLLAQ